MAITEQTAQAVLNIVLPRQSDFGEVTIKEAVLRLGLQVWREGEEFSGKRPRGNSDWQGQITDAVIEAGYSSDDWREAEDVVDNAIEYLIQDICK